MGPFNPNKELTVVKNAVFAVVVTAAVMASIHAQDDMSAPKELGRYDIMLGNWTGSGSVWMTADAERLGADGIVCMRFTTSAMAQGAAELLVYGTVVKLKKG